MATALPSAFSFEMLSKLPANSFVAEWREFLPDTLPTGGLYKGSQSQRARFHLRGAPNEFLLNTHCYLSGSAQGYIKTNVGATGLTGGPEKIKAHDEFVSGRTMFWNSPFHFFRASRESFNSDSLPWNDNQDQVVSHEVNQLRMMLARRDRRGVDLNDLEDLTDCFTSPNQALRLVQNGLDLCLPASKGLVVTDKDDGAVTDRGSKAFNIPLGLYSNMINSHSVIPIGLMSSYSVNGYSIAVDTQDVTTKITEPATGVVGGYLQSYLINTNSFKVGTTDVIASAYDTCITNLRIYGLVVKILDPAIMTSVLRLYQKEEQVNVGGVQFPLSLRMNSIAYRTFRHRVQGGMNHFRLPGTDRSVRAYAWKMFNTTNSKNGNWSLNPNSNIRVSRLETRIGTELPHPVIEDSRAAESNVNNFIRSNDKKSGALFSPLPYYQEGRVHETSQMDRLLDYNHTSGEQYKDISGALSTLSFVSYNFGVVSLENLDRREGDYSGGFQASGKDLTNVGAIDVFMTVSSPAVYSAGTTPTVITSVEDVVNKRSWSNSIDNNLEIVFMYAYDSVMEVSPAGVMDITNAVM